MNQPSTAQSVLDQTGKISGRARTLGARAGKRLGTLMRNTVAERRAGRDFGARDGDNFPVAVYFSGDEHALYQVQQWLWAFERLDEALRADGGEGVVIFCRQAHAAQELAAMTPLPIRWARLMSHTDEFFDTNPLRLVFYVNQNTLNFQGLRFAEPAHVHLSHGESEKSSMVSNQLKAYDAVFTAGPAARERIAGALHGFGHADLRDVGRPQFDEPTEVPADWDVSRAEPTVLYAPTWEGDSDAMAYSSVLSLGEEIVGSLLAGGRRVIYRPHPRTGVYSPRYADAHDRIVALIETHNRDTEGPDSLVDIDSPFGWQLHAADAAVADMSAVGFDWLVTGKPQVMTEPMNPALLDSSALATQIPVVNRGNVADLAELLDAQVGGDSARARRALAEHYFGDITPGSHILRFIEASRALVAERSRELDASS